MGLVEAMKALYHVSNNPNLEIDPNHEHRQGEMGKGFYVTTDPRAWRDTLTGRYVYSVDPRPLRIARGHNYPSHVQLAHWAIERGYMRMAPVVRPATGEVIRDQAGEPLIRPEVTEAGKRFLWQDPMTGGSIMGLANEYLREKGFNALEASYSPEGQQIIILDPSVVKLKKITRIPR